MAAVEAIRKNKVVGVYAGLWRTEAEMKALEEEVPIGHIRREKYTFLDKETGLILDGFDSTGYRVGTQMMCLNDPSGLRQPDGRKIKPNARFLVGYVTCSEDEIAYPVLFVFADKRIEARDIIYVDYGMQNCSISDRLENEEVTAPFEAWARNPNLRSAVEKLSGGGKRPRDGSDLVSGQPGKVARLESIVRRKKADIAKAHADIAKAHARAKKLEQEKAELQKSEKSAAVEIAALKRQLATEKAESKRQLATEKANAKKREAALKTKHSREIAAVKTWVDNFPGVLTS